MVFHLPLRQTERFLRSLAQMLEVEVQIACRVLNTMTRLGMPDSYRLG